MVKKVDSDMSISIPKTKVMYVFSQDQITSTTHNYGRSEKILQIHLPPFNMRLQIQDKTRHVCSSRQMLLKKSYKVKLILDCTGDICQHKYKIRWDCYPPAPDTWEVRGNLHPETIKEFERERTACIRVTALM